MGFSNLTKIIERKIITFLKSQREVLYFGKTIGKFNIDVIVRNPLELKSFINRVRSHFGNILESRENILMFDQKKNDYFPEGVIEDSKDKMHRR